MHRGKPAEDFTDLYFSERCRKISPKSKLLKLLSLQTSSFSGYVASGLVSKHFSSKYDIQLPTVHSL